MLHFYLHICRKQKVPCLGQLCWVVVLPLSLGIRLSSAKQHGGRVLNWTFAGGPFQSLCCLCHFWLPALGHSTGDVRTKLVGQWASSVARSACQVGVKSGVWSLRTLKGNKHDCMCLRSQDWGHSEVEVESSLVSQEICKVSFRFSERTCSNGLRWKATEEETMACSGLCIGDDCIHPYIHGPGTHAHPCAHTCAHTCTHKHTCAYTHAHTSTCTHTLWKLIDF